jgi:hypothetical protein
VINPNGASGGAMAVPEDADSSANQCVPFVMSVFLTAPQFERFI